MFDIEKARERGIDESSIKIMEGINENTRKRKSCPFHEFEREEPFTGMWICKNCECRESTQYVMGYEDGLKHAATQCKEDNADVH